MLLASNRGVEYFAAIPSSSASGQVASVAAFAPSSNATTSAASVAATSSLPRKKAAPKPAAALVQDTEVAAPSVPAPASDGQDVYRVEDPYPFAPQPVDTVNILTRSALVNILCIPFSGSMNPVSGSGVIIDPRGVILTNAHVAQYILLAESSKVSLSCVIRTGAPAQAQWHAEVLYIPPVWVRAHAADITAQHPTGTGEHDYALLRITDSISGAPLSAVPSLSFDTREGVSFIDDEVLLAGYPAEFMGGMTTESALFPVTSTTKIKDMFTLQSSTVDVVSLGGVIQAQGGSSGGAMVNAWNFLVGIITTTSEGKTTAERDLHALTLSYIDRDLRAQSGLGLKETLAGDVASEAATFSAQQAPALQQLLINQLRK